MVSEQIWEVRINETRAHSHFVRARSQVEAQQIGMDAWLSGDDGDEFAEDSVDWQVTRVSLAPDRTTVTFEPLPEGES